MLGPRYELRGYLSKGYMGFYRHVYCLTMTDCGVAVFRCRFKHQMVEGEGDDDMSCTGPQMGHPNRPTLTHKL
jgi:hypothetical protein